MGRAVRRSILWGTMAIGSSKRRSYLFRVDPAGLVAVRVGNPFSWSAFFGIVLACFWLLGSTPIGWASLLAGGGVGFVALGILNRGIARGIASQTRERVLRSTMNTFLPKEDWRGAKMAEGQGYTFIELTSLDRAVRIAIVRPRRARARELLRPLFEAS